MGDTSAQRKIGRMTADLCRTVLAFTCLAVTALPGRSARAGEADAPEEGYQGVAVLKVIPHFKRDPKGHSTEGAERVGGRTVSFDGKRIIVGEEEQDRPARSVR